MSIPLRIFAGALVLAGFAFCTFGFAATFEPNPPVQQWTWRAIYAGAGLVSLLGLHRLLRPAGRVVAVVVPALLLGLGSMAILALRGV